MSFYIYITKLTFHLKFSFLCSDKNSMLISLCPSSSYLLDYTNVLEVHTMPQGWRKASKNVLVAQSRSLLNSSSSLSHEVEIKQIIPIGFSFLLLSDAISFPWINLFSFWLPHQCHLHVPSLHVATSLLWLALENWTLHCASPSKSAPLWWSLCKYPPAMVGTFSAMTLTDSILDDPFSTWNLWNISFYLLPQLSDHTVCNVPWIYLICPPCPLTPVSVSLPHWILENMGVFSRPLWPCPYVTEIILSATKHGMRFISTGLLNVYLLPNPLCLPYPSEIGRLGFANRGGIKYKEEKCMF